MSTTSPRPVQPEDLLAIKTIADVQLSPDGRRIAYVLSEIDATKDDYRTSIWVVDTAPPAPPVVGGLPSEPRRTDSAESAGSITPQNWGARGAVPRRFTRGPKRDSAPRWSPDGSRLAFLSDRDGDRAQLYVMPADGGEPVKLTALSHGAGAAAWSPDGTKILFAARVPNEPAPEDKDAKERWEQRPKVVTRAHYKDDGAGYTFDGRMHLFVVEAAEGAAVAQLAHGTCNEGGPAWSPDGARIAFSRTRDGAADYNASDIWVANADGTNQTRLTETVGRANTPSWSPDGQTIACYGTDEQMRGLGDPIVRVWTVPAAGGTPYRLTAAYDRGAFVTPGSTPAPVWSADGGTLTFPVADSGNAHLVRCTMADGSVRVVVGGERQASLLSAAPGAGRMAFCATSTVEPGDVYNCDWDGAGEQRLTRINDELLAQLAFPLVERRSFASPNGGTIDGWLTLPLQAAGPAPLLVHIHGGPHSFVGNTFQQSSFYWYTLAARGWAVLALNPSGSGSYGRAFALSTRGRWGEYDLPEQHAAIDALIAEGIADRDRLAVTGYSYGGYMTSWTIGHTDRFKAAVVGAPVTNLESFHGTADIGMWFSGWEMEGELFGNRETFRRLSPVTYVDRVTTPTLILHGEADDRCPIGQGEEFFVGLVAAGNVPAEMVRYPGGSHLFISTGRPSHRVDFTRRIMDWVERYTLSGQDTGSREQVGTAAVGDA